ncbi:Forkhead-associated (FHA) domain-containing protein [Forsythia ovata]|uniref:Forkhead-associated (FHA) domain-containing protein n=1 Tax=Forsythia ovata TaxID=205694 RepID=A0ABD1PWN6_9LAMI
MGAVAPLPNWIPEDDLLLKNAVEAGASLESLAKGAVQFSRRFTRQELQDRWYSLLYDPVVSAEASARMIEFERCASTLQSGPNRPDSTKEMKCSTGKRKAESIRKHYYAMRKRILDEPFNAMDIFCLAEPGNSNFGDGNEHPSADCMIENPVPNHFGINGGVGIQDRVEDLPLTGNNVSRVFCHTNEENISMPGGFGQSKESHVCDFFETDDLEIKNPAVFGQTNQNGGNVHSEFGGTSFHSFGYSSPLPHMPSWSTMHDISATSLPVHLGERDQQTGKVFVRTEASDAINTDASKLKNSVPNMRNLTPSSEDFFVELTNTLFDFTNEEDHLFMDADGKDPIEKSYIDGLSSLLLDSPNNSELPNVVPEAPDAHFTVTRGACSEESGKKELYQSSILDTQITPVQIVKAFGPEYRNGVICCTLNTEDPEIPSNDDVFLPFRFPSPSNSSGAHWRDHNACYLMPSSLKDFSSTRKANGGQLPRKTEQKDSRAPSRVVGLSQQSDTGANNRIGSYRMKFELPNSSIQHLASRNARTSEGPSPISSVKDVTKNLVPGVVKEGTTEMVQGKNLDYKSAGPCLDKHFHDPDSVQNFQKSIIGSKKDLDAKATVPKNGELNAESNSVTMLVSEPVEKPLLSDEEEPYSENDLDMPYFSDIESMILDMDLGPDELGLQSSQEVLRYKHDETKKTIIRLEQAADGYMQRAIAAQGAFAVLYGHRSKHFIKKSEVLLGRATEDVKVDIDLGREKNGGKISRRQAIIKMDVYGSFHLMNIGKSPISVNGKEVASTMSVTLISGCLIEVRGSTFIFETNDKRIKQHVDDIMKASCSRDHNKPLIRR